MKPEATSDSYGVSLQSPAWVLKQLTKLGGLRVVHFAESTWHRHQDCFSCVRDDSVRYAADSSTIPVGNTSATSSAIDSGLPKESPPIPEGFGYPR